METKQGPGFVEQVLDLLHYLFIIVMPKMKAHTKVYLKQFNILLF